MISSSVLATATGAATIATRAAPDRAPPNHDLNLFIFDLLANVLEVSGAAVYCSYTIGIKS